MLMGTKDDLDSKRTVTKEEAEGLAKEMGIPAYCETSSKTPAGIDEAFEKLAKLIRSALGETQNTDKGNVKIKTTETTPVKKRCDILS